MPASTIKQARAARAELARRREGKAPQKFKGMSTAELRKFTRVE